MDLREAVNTTALPDPAQITRHARRNGMFCHLAAFATLFLPLGNLLGPLLVWSIQKSSHPFVDEQGREAINFQITVTVISVAALVLAFLYGDVRWMLSFSSFFAIGAGVLVIVAASNANKGLAYRYPLCIRFINSAQSDARKGSQWLKRFGATISPGIVSLLFVSIWSIEQVKQHSTPGWEGLGILFYFIVFVPAGLLFLLVYALITARATRSISSSALFGLIAAVILVGVIVGFFQL